MNPTKIEYADLVWNLITGCSGPRAPPNRRCPYCYGGPLTRRFGKQWGYEGPDMFKWQYHPKRLNDPYKISIRFRSKNPDMPPGRAIIFVNSMGEIFDDAMQVTPVMEMLKMIETVAYDRKLFPEPHQFIILTKKPFNAYKLLTNWWGGPADTKPLPPNLWLGVTIDEQLYMDRVRLFIPMAANIPGDWHPFLNIEPILSRIMLPSEEILNRMEWMIIGAETGNRRGKVTPEVEWIKDLWNDAKWIRGGIPVFLKDNLLPIIESEGIDKEKLEYEYQEWPSAMGAGKWPSALRGTE